MLWPEPASAAEIPAALLSVTRTMSYFGSLVKTSAGKCAALFLALVAVL